MEKKNQKNPTRQLNYLDFYPEMKPLVEASREVVMGYEDYLREKIDHIDLAKKMLVLRKHLDLPEEDSILVKDQEN